jgi:protein SCO1/2
MTKIFLLAIALIAIISACSNHTVTSTAVKRYPIEGKIVSINPGDQTAKIDHSEIKGWMGAMTMDYSIPSKTDYGKLHPGDHIRGTVFVQNDEFWVGDITDDTKQP